MGGAHVGLWPCCTLHRAAAGSVSGRASRAGGHGIAYREPAPFPSASRLFDAFAGHLFFLSLISSNQIRFLSHLSSPQAPRLSPLSLLCFALVFALVFLLFCFSRFAFPRARAARARVFIFRVSCLVLWIVFPVRQVSLRRWLAGRQRRGRLVR